MTELSRRRTMLAAASAGAIAVSGCLSEAGDGPSDDGTGPNGETGPDDENEGESDDEANTDDGNDGDEETDARDAPGIVDGSIETTDTDCGSPEDAGVEVALDGETVTVTGAIPAPNPCHEAVLEEATLESGRLSLAIDVSTDDDGGCVQCHGRVEYAARIDVDDASAVETVAVEHADGDTYRVDRDEFGSVDENRFELGSTSIETVGTDCGSGDDDSISVDPGDETVVVAGVLPASTPCYEAVLEDVAVADETLSLVVDVRSTLEEEEDEACTDCVGLVEYEAVIEVSNAADLGSVRVDHVTGGSHGAGWESASETAGSDS